MTTRDAATRHVAERCPCCGVEHKTVADAVCEACDTPLRRWCSRHGRETGWLAAPSCPRCGEEAARSAAPTRATRAPAALPCPDISRAAAGAAPPVAGAVLPEKVPVAAAAQAKPRKPAELLEHLSVMFLMMLMTAGGGTLLGVIAGFVVVFSGRGTIPDTALRFALGGAVPGLIVGGFSCLDYVRHLSASPPEP